MTIECFPTDRQHLVSLYNGDQVIGEAYHHEDTDTWDYDTILPDGRRVFIGEFSSIRRIVELEEEQQNG